VRVPPPAVFLALVAIGVVPAARAAVLLTQQDGVHPGAVELQPLAAEQLGGHMVPPHVAAGPHVRSHRHEPAQFIPPKHAPEPVHAIEHAPGPQLIVPSQLFVPVHSIVHAS
jgi:hypothetical protein